MRIRVVHALIDEVDGIEVLRGLAEGSRLVPTMFAILAAPYLCFACERPVFLENESSDYTAVFGRLRESLRTKPLHRPVFTVREGSTHSRTRHT